MRIECSDQSVSPIPPPPLKASDALNSARVTRLAHNHCLLREIRSRRFSSRMPNSRAAHSRNGKALHQIVRGDRSERFPREELELRELFDLHLGYAHALLPPPAEFLRRRKCKRRNFVRYLYLTNPERGRQ